MNKANCYEVYSIFDGTKTMKELLIELLLDNLCTFDCNKETN